MFWLAWKTILHEKGRFVLTLTGIIFSTVLVLTEVGIYIGMMGNATCIIRNTDADIWIAPKNIQNFDFANPVPEGRINRVKALPEVLDAEKLIVSWAFLKLANGGQEQVQVIGFNPDTMAGAPWKMLSGTASDVKGGKYMIIDSSSESRIGKLEMNSVWELGGRSFRLVGISEGVKSFTTTPVVFMSYNQVQNLSNGLIKAGQTSYIVAKLRDSNRSREVVASLRTALKDNEVMTKEEFILKTVRYWTVQTGAGMSFFLTAILGLSIGGAIVGQTIYANTIQYIKEYGTLKALGAANEDIYKTIFSQAGINGMAGYLTGSVLVLSSRGLLEEAGVPVYVSPAIFLAIFFIIGFTCLFSAWFSVRKIKTLDPVTVFRA